MPVIKTVAKAHDLEGMNFTEEETNNVGARHRSAYRLAGGLPGSVAIVVSQDGGVRFLSARRPSYLLGAGVTTFCMNDAMLVRMSFLFPIEVNKNDIPAIPGLSYLPEYVTAAQENRLTTTIDQGIWDSTWERRVSYSVELMATGMKKFRRFRIGDRNLRNKCCRKL